MTETGVLVNLEVTDAIVSFKKQKEVWLPENRDQECSIIGKFTQGAKADGKSLTGRLVTDSVCTLAWQHAGLCSHKSPCDIIRIQPR